MMSALGICGCGTTKSRDGTEQLLASDAVDRAISQIDFRELSGKKVYFDTQYIKAVKGVGFVNSDYIVSSMRQQLIAANCLVQDKEADAEIIVEPRVGALGSNGHEVSYGIPASGALTTAASIVPTMPAVPTIPELSLAKRDDQSAAAKISIFAYDRTTRHPVWQSGTLVAQSHAKDTWVLGMGPFQRGTIYEGTQFAGNRIGLPLVAGNRDQVRPPIVPYTREYIYTEFLAKEEKPADGAEGDVAGKEGAPAKEDEPGTVAQNPEAKPAAASKPANGKPDKPEVNPVSGVKGQKAPKTDGQVTPAGHESAIDTGPSQEPGASPRGSGKNAIPPATRATGSRTPTERSGFRRWFRWPSFLRGKWFGRSRTSSQPDSARQRTSARRQTISNPSTVSNSGTEPISLNEAPVPSTTATSPGRVTLSQ